MATYTDLVSGLSSELWPGLDTLVYRIEIVPVPVDYGHPCALDPCVLYGYREPGNRWHYQHGPNPEHSIIVTDEQLSAHWRENQAVVEDWLRRVHEYEREQRYV